MSVDSLVAEAHMARKFIRLIPVGISETKGESKKCDQCLNEFA